MSTTTFPGDIRTRAPWADVKAGTVGQRFRIDSITYDDTDDTTTVEYSEVQS